MVKKLVKGDAWVFVVIVIVVLFVAYGFFERGFPQFYPSVVVDKDGVSFEVRPLKLFFGSNSEFEVIMKADSGSLDFNVGNVVVLQDSSGRVFKPSQWTGSSEEENPRRGILAFPSLAENVTGVKLVFFEGSAERVFEWSLK